jgi:para-aminobenzoate synthetase/4-amino-4-deoxychorismate lyase
MYNRVFSDARARGFEDALFLNERGEVTECAIHNVMIAKDGRLVTPPLACGLLPGVYRRHLMARHPDVQEAVVTLDDIMSADRIFIFNSVRGLRMARITVGSYTTKVLELSTPSTQLLPETNSKHYQK